MVVNSLQKALINSHIVLGALRMNWSNNLSKKLRNSYNAMKRLLREINI
jgi:hypothetical protein